ncbi:MAG: 50S ribosomal protein L10 [Eubacteriales bacterium]|nr:50S ribosomal protein L10 [Eubacteriales bacterium]
MPGDAALKRKTKIVKDLAEKIRKSQGMILADYRGLTVQQDTEMRRAFRQAGVEYKVVKNTLTAFAMKENDVQDIGEYLKGPTAIAFSENDPVTSARVMTEFAAKYGKLEIKTGLLDGKLINVEDIQNLAKLPSKEVLIAKALGGLKAPVNGLVNVLNANIRGLVVALSAISEKQGVTKE